MNCANLISAAASPCSKCPFCTVTYEECELAYTASSSPRLGVRNPHPKLPIANVSGTDQAIISRITSIPEFSTLIS